LRTLVGSPEIYDFNLVGSGLVEFSHELVTTMRKNMKKTKSDAFLVIAIVVLFLICISWSQVAYYDYDSFYNLQTPKNIIEKGIYATYYNSEYHLYDLAITTGVTTLFPVAMFIKFFGSSLEFRVFMIIYLIATCLLLYAISRRLFDTKIALMSLVGIIFVPGILPLSMKVDGEIPATLYFLIGFYYLQKSEIESSRSSSIRYILAGAFFAFAILSKLIFAILAFPVLLYIFIAKHKTRSKIIMIVSFLMPFLIWEAYKIWTLGIAKYNVLRSNVLEASINQGAPTGLVPISNMIEKTAYLSAIFGVDRISLILTLAVCIAFFFYLIIYGLRNQKPLLSMYVSFVLLSFLIWFLFMTRLWIRYLIPYMILSIPIIIYLIAILFSEMKRINGVRKVALFLILAFFMLNLTISMLSTTRQNIMEYGYYSNILENQNRFVQDLQTLPLESKVGYWGWWKSPEMSYFVRNEFIDLSANNYSDFIIITPEQIFFDNNSIESLSVSLGDKIFQECNAYGGCYYLYKYKNNILKYNLIPRMKNSTLAEVQCTTDKNFVIRCV
jgi:hypothetical protein